MQCTGSACGSLGRLLVTGGLPSTSSRPPPLRVRPGTRLNVGCKVMQSVPAAMRALARSTSRQHTDSCSVFIGTQRPQLHHSAWPMRWLPPPSFPSLFSSSSDSLLWRGSNWKWFNTSTIAAMPTCAASPDSIDDKDHDSDSDDGDDIVPHVRFEQTNSAIDSSTSFNKRAPQRQRFLS